MENPVIPFDQAYYDGYKNVFADEVPETYEAYLQYQKTKSGSQPQPSPNTTLLPNIEQQSNNDRYLIERLDSEREPSNVYETQLEIDWNKYNVNDNLVFDNYQNTYCHPISQLIISPPQVIQN